MHSFLHKEIVFFCEYVHEKNTCRENTPYVKHIEWNESASWKKDIPNIFFLFKSMGYSGYSIDKFPLVQEVYFISLL